MNIWGERYAEVSLFEDYCRDLNVNTGRGELEHYEKVRAMLPVARVVYPDEYVIQRDQNQWNGVTDWDGAGQWPELDRLLKRGLSVQSGDEGSSDEKVVHSFDREMEAGANPYLIRPELSEFRPWSEYRVEVPDGRGNSIMRPTAEHYYSYWQVHQLFLIQQYPDLYKNVGLIERIPQEDSLKKSLPRAPKEEYFVDFAGMRLRFDAISFWIALYHREHENAFAGVAEVDGVRSLDDAQATAYRTKLALRAAQVKERFQLTPGDLYGFLHKLIELLEGYERKERYKLVDALKDDIFAWENLLTLATGKTREDVAEELGRTNIYDERTFRHLDIRSKEHDYSLELLTSVSADCERALRQLGDSQWSFPEADVDELLNYCEREGLGLFVTALSGMVATGDEEYRQISRRVQRYTNLKNVLNSYEYLLKTLGLQAGQIVGNETLTPLVDKVMAQELWYQSFGARKQSGLLSTNSTQAFLTNLGSLLADSQLKGSPQGYWAQQFLVTCLARNMTVHSYPSQDSYYGDLFGRMLHAVVSATFYTWRHAKAQGWV